jgi:phage baseplate assembly protein W
VGTLSEEAIIMDERVARFGTDLRLLDDLERQNSRQGGNDLLTVPHQVPGEGELRVDLETVNGVANLQQALLLRLLTPAGELTVLGHPDYGSRLFELIGERNTEMTRNRAKLYTLQALTAEPRVREVRTVTVTPDAKDRTQINIAVRLVAITGDTPLNFVFPFFLAGGVQP